LGAIQVDGYTGELTGRAGEAGARFERLPYKLKDGRRRFAHNDFGNELIGALYRVMPPEPKRFLFGAGKCQRCGSPLPTQPRPHSFALALDIQGLERILLTAELPSVRCAACGTEHRTGGRDVESDLSEAMIAAFESAGLTY
jgi:hypothetical protein